MHLSRLSRRKTLKIGSKCITTASHHQSSTALSITCTRLFRGKMHSDCFHGVEILQGRWQHREEMGFWYPSGHAKTFCKWDINDPLVTKGLIPAVNERWLCIHSFRSLSYGKASFPQCYLELRLWISIILSFSPGHPVVAYAFFSSSSHLSLSVVH